MEPLNKLQKCLEMSGLKEETCQSYTYKINIFLRTIDKETNGITLDDILEYLRHLRYVKEYCIGTVNSYRNAIKYFYEVERTGGRTGEEGQGDVSHVLTKYEIIINTKKIHCNNISYHNLQAKTKIIIK